MREHANHIIKHKAKGELGEYLQSYDVIMSMLTMIPHEILHRIILNLLPLLRVYKS